MRAQLLYDAAPIETGPLRLSEIPVPSVSEHTLLVKVHACGVCHTDLHVVEGELPDPLQPVVPGHEVVGSVVETGSGVTSYQPGDRVGIPWLHQACGRCDYCQRGQENLCPLARFTGYTAQGGYAEYLTVPHEFAVRIPDIFTDVEAAPLLCAGIVGYRSLRLSEVQPGERLGLYGFGASGHICIQVARYWGCDVFVFTRSPDHQAHARALGAAWTGSAEDQPPALLDRAIVFAPAGRIVPLALSHLRPAGTLCINAIHMSPIPELSYELLWRERTIRSVANATRQDAAEFMPLAAQIPIQTETRSFPLEEANQVLQQVKHSEISGAAVLVPG